MKILIDEVRCGMVVGEMGRGRVCVEALPIVRSTGRLQKKQKN